MPITKACEYALLLLLFTRKDIKLKDVKTILCKLEISKSFLAKVLQSLAKNGISISYKGTKATFMPNKHFDDIFVIEVIKAMEKKNLLVFSYSFLRGYYLSNCIDSCIVWPLLNRLQSNILIKV